MGDPATLKLKNCRAWTVDICLKVKDIGKTIYKYHLTVNYHHFDVVLLFYL